MIEQFDDGRRGPQARMEARAAEASDFLKAISHPGRLMLLCHLAEGERTVTELEELLELRQSAVSQQLARLRLDGIVMSRREGKKVVYALADDRPRQMLDTISAMFCRPRPS